MLGISQEQHGDRTHLFMQWQQMEWPVMIDSLNLLEVTAVPITLLIDKSGVIRYSNPNATELDAFLAADYPDQTAPAPLAWSQQLTDAVATVNSGRHSELTTAIQTFQRIQEKSPRQWFHLGVLHRKRFDSPTAQASDFGDAVTAWGQALAGDPGQYIWRRRIQQYGPRLDKPYPFYDWVPKAREAIVKRGEKPVNLVIEPSGAEYAIPGKSVVTSSTRTHPDPRNRLPVDARNLVTVTSVAVPSTDAKKPGWRVHLTFTPDSQTDTHWNNESGPMVVWWEPSETWNPSADIQGIEVAGNRHAEESATSAEIRQIEFELIPTQEKPVPAELTGNAYIYVCEGASGTCMYLRKTFTVKL